MISGFSSAHEYATPPQNPNHKQPRIKETAQQTHHRRLLATTFGNHDSFDTSDSDSGDLTYGPNEQNDGEIDATHPQRSDSKDEGSAADGDLWAAETAQPPNRSLLAPKFAPTFGTHDSFDTSDSDSGDSADVPSDQNDDDDDDDDDDTNEELPFNKYHFVEWQFNLFWDRKGLCTYLTQVFNTSIKGDPETAAKKRKTTAMNRFRKLFNLVISLVRQR